MEMKALIFIFVCLSALSQTPTPNSATDDSAHSNIGGAVGPNTYYDVTTTTTGTGTGMAAMRWCTVTVAQAGTATKIRVYISGYFGGACNYKTALYNLAGTTLLAQSSAQSTTATGYNEYTFTASVAVSATDYLIAIMADTGNAEVNRIGTGTRQDDTSALVYGSFPPATVPAHSANTGVLTCGVFVQ